MFNQIVELLTELFKWRNKSVESKQHKEVSATMSETNKVLKEAQEETRQAEIELNKSLKSGKRDHLENDW